MLTTNEAAAVLRVSRRRVNELIALGTLKAERPGRDWQIDPASVESFKKTPRHAGRPRTIPMNGTDYHVFGED